MALMVGNGTCGFGRSKTSPNSAPLVFPDMPREKSTRFPIAEMDSPRLRDLESPRWRRIEGCEKMEPEVDVLSLGGEMMGSSLAREPDRGPGPLSVFVVGLWDGG